MKQIPWLDPWLAYLEDKGVNFHKGCSLAGITMEGATVGSAIKHVKIQDAFTGIPNLFLASDYVKAYTDLATMEGANEAARRAVNGILDASKSEEKKEKIWPYKTPKTLKALRRKDKKRWEAGLPWQDPRRKSKKKKSRR